LYIYGVFFFSFFFVSSTSNLHTLSLHDALPIFCNIPPHLHTSDLRISNHPSSRRNLPWPVLDHSCQNCCCRSGHGRFLRDEGWLDRKSTRLNSSHVKISYAVFCLKKKNLSDSPE